MAENSINCKLLLIGGSAGSLDLILSLIAGLPGKISFTIIIVVHRKNSTSSILPSLIATRTTLRVKEAEDKETIEPGSIYIAPANYHLLVEKDGTLSIDSSEKIKHSRPSIDVTFQTAAEAFGAQVVALLLSGASSDGTDGLKTVKHFGGVALVQDPASAEVPYMPEFAISNVAVDKVLQPGLIVNIIKELSAMGLC